MHHERQVGVGQDEDGPLPIESLSLRKASCWTGAPNELDVVLRQLRQRSGNGAEVLMNLR